jgi:hypothetical protein
MIFILKRVQCEGNIRHSDWPISSIMFMNRMKVFFGEDRLGQEISTPKRTNDAVNIDLIREFVPSTDYGVNPKSQVRNMVPRTDQAGQTWTLQAAIGASYGHRRATQTPYSIIVVHSDGEIKERPTTLACRIGRVGLCAWLINRSINICCLLV